MDVPDFAPDFADVNNLSDEDNSNGNGTAIHLVIQDRTPDETVAVPMAEKLVDK